MRLDHVRCGFVPLSDSAVLVAAVEMGFAASEGIALELQREASWSNIRDRISLGVYPVAHMLSPMALAISMGLGPVPHPIDVPFVLNLNGNVLVARAEVAAELAQLGATPKDAAATGAALARRIARSGLRIGVPYPHSMHLLLTRYLLESSGAEMGNVTISVAPPPILPGMMQAGEVDAFMVGEPWGSMAVERGDANILLPGAAIWSAAPEKVLGARRDWLEDNTDTARRLLRALAAAAKWCSLPGSRPILAEILSMPRYVDAPADVIQRGLEGDLICSPSGDAFRQPDFIRFSGDATNFPWRSGGMWIAQHAAPLWGLSKSEVLRVGHDAFRSDVFRQALAQTDAEIPANPSRTEGGDTRLATGGAGEISADRAHGIFFDGRIFAFPA